MLDILDLRKSKNKILCLGSHRGIIQSILDYDYLLGQRPSVKAVLASGRKYERYFFGESEILLPVFATLSALPKELLSTLNLFLNLQSARRALSSTLEVLNLPKIQGGVIFAEDVPEKHALELLTQSSKKGQFIVGPASVGLLIPGNLKLGAIGGVDYRQFEASRLFTPGSIAVLCASGGMTNEIIRILGASNKHVSFALHFGGDRFPVVSPKDAFLICEQDPKTETILYAGELGGFDEYEIAELVREGKISKKVICFIAGSISELFPKAPQFGHAKAMAAREMETAFNKKKALEEAGCVVAKTFTEFIAFLKKIPDSSAKIKKKEYNALMAKMDQRQHALIVSSISQDVDDEVKILQEDLLSFAKKYSFAYEAVSLFLGRQIKSKELEEFVDFVLRLLVDHGPYVSGALNTIVTARAGRDMVSSLAAGLLTIGDRFGGALNQAAANWLSAVAKNQDANEFVEEFASRKKYIPGIGHKKYRSDLPDPRVTELLQYKKKLTKTLYIDFAKRVEKVTTAKKGNLILNVDGAIAALLLDFLSEKEGFSEKELAGLVETEFFNAFFVLSRSVGFISHFLDQKRLDEGLLRLDASHVLDAKLTS